MKALEKHFKNYKSIKNRRFVLNIVLDGIAIAKHAAGDAFAAAYKPTISALQKGHAYTTLNAHGPFVGMPLASDMGNSEVGHNALGAGKIFAQGAKLVGNSIKSGEIFKGKAWLNAIESAKKPQKALQLITLVSDGNVHSHINHLLAISKKAAASGCKNIVLHALLDGRDTPPRSSTEYLTKVEQHFTSLNSEYGCNACIASCAGRMVSVMDRYEAEWSMVETGWQLMVEGMAKTFSSALEGVQHFHANDENDQYITPFLVGNKNNPPRLIEDGDAVLLLNFRGDRALEISRAFTGEVPFKKSKEVDVYFAGMMLYDGDTAMPKNYLVNPPQIAETMGEFLVASGLHLFAVSETQKYGHVTYFWNGNRSKKFSETQEEYIEIKSDNVPFEERPWMKAAEITDATIRLLRTGRFSFGRINYPNGDMVGHTGNFNAARMAVEATDMSLARLLDEVKKLGGIAIVTADHGNCDEMFQINKNGDVQTDSHDQPLLKTSHTLNKVPFSIYDPLYNDEYHLSTAITKAGIANIAATTLELLGFKAPTNYEPSLIQWK